MVQSAPERPPVPNPHRFATVVGLMMMFGPVDMGRQHVSGGLDKEYDREATNRTRRHVNSMLYEMHKPVERYEAWVAAKAYECGLAGCNLWQDHVCEHELWIRTMFYVCKHVL